MNNNLKIYSKMWAVKRLENKSTIPLAYMCHLGDSPSQESKRKDTGRSWAKRKYSIEYETDEVEFDNAPIRGFIITDDIKRTYWGGGNVKWRIEDPRGFEVEISSENLMSIIRSCEILECKILGEFVWAREGGQNILIPVDSDEYKNSQQKAESAVKTKVEPMTVYYDGYGNMKAYLGKVYAFGERNKWGQHHCSLHVYIDPKTNETRVYSPKLSKVQPQTTRVVRKVTELEYDAVIEGNTKLSFKPSAKPTYTVKAEVKELTYDLAKSYRALDYVVKYNEEYVDVYDFWYGAKKFAPNYIMEHDSSREWASYWKVYRRDFKPIEILELGWKHNED